MKYRKLPVEIDAFKWTGGPDQEEDPEWIIEAIKNGTAWFENEGTPDVKFMIQTLEGIHEASVGDYIICGSNGEIYTCKPEVFVKTYEPVNSSNFWCEGSKKHSSMWGCVLEKC